MWELNISKFYLYAYIRFANAKGAFIYPMHGHGELPQAFCRFAAVKGALYVR
jgi:RAB protein geranylgeranyltransferase component A